MRFSEAMTHEVRENDRLLGGEVMSTEVKYVFDDEDLEHVANDMGPIAGVSQRGGKHQQK